MVKGQPERPSFSKELNGSGNRDSPSESLIAGAKARTHTSGYIVLLPSHFLLPSGFSRLVSPASNPPNTEQQAPRPQPRGKKCYLFHTPGELQELLGGFRRLAILALQTPALLEKAHAHPPCSGQVIRWLGLRRVTLWVGHE